MLSKKAKYGLKALLVLAEEADRGPMLISELADLFYHLLVLMVERDVKLGEVANELTRRAAPKRP